MKQECIVLDVKPKGWEWNLLGYFLEHQALVPILLAVICGIDVTVTLTEHKDKLKK